MDLMRCEICKRYCNYDNSVGKEHYIVCNDCYNAVAEDFIKTNKNLGLEESVARLIPLQIFFMLSDVRENNK
jgi:hypothetical protein